MTDSSVDIAILGAGFGGSLTALLLARSGFTTVLIDRAAHPRFAIGESSTPLADLVLRDLCRAYRIPSLEPLAQYGTWQQAYPEVTCGMKRGFSYFRHTPEQRFEVSREHSNELLVAASSDDYHSDTHWLRADVDRLIADEARRSGVPLFDRTTVSLVPQGNRWAISGNRNEEPVHFVARFVVDATGGESAILGSLKLPVDRDRFRTNSRALFAHFNGVEPWETILASRNARITDYPFPCDHSAQHHILEEGWMWQLRFNNGLTSAGLVLDGNDFPPDPTISPDREWDRVLKRYPSLADQFQAASLVHPPGSIRRTGRLQRRASQLVGPNWALLPSTAGFIDPLHSTGIAHTLWGIERLVPIIKTHWQEAGLADALRLYEQQLDDELDFIDELVSGCYQARHHFRLFVAFSMLYFAAATTCEHRRAEKTLSTATAFLGADDPALRRIVGSLRRELGRILESRRLSETELRAFEDKVTLAIEPYNVAGLCDRSAWNMYHHTTARKD